MTGQTAPVDKRRRPFVAIDLHFPFKNTCLKLEDEFGYAGPLAFLYMIMAAKRAPIQGELTFTTDADFWAQIGVTNPPEWDVDTFLRRLAKLRQITIERPSKYLRSTRFTHFEDWQRLPEAELQRRRSARKRAQNTRDETRTKPAPNPHYLSTERTGEETTTGSLPLPSVEGENFDAAATTPQAAPPLTNGGKPTRTCPECGLAIRPPTTLADHLWQTHDIERAPA